jgi:excisionase family DNA binding protein
MSCRLLLNQSRSEKWLRHFSLMIFKEGNNPASSRFAPNREEAPRHGMNNDANKPWVAIDSEPSKSCARGKQADTNATRRAFDRHFLSKQELAFAVGVSPRTIDNWIAQKRIPFLRLSTRLIKFNLERVKAALARYEIKEIGAPR